MKIRKGDNVIVIAGKDRGKKGKVAKTYPKNDLLVVEGVNLKKKRQKAVRGGQKGEVIEKTEPIHVSNVMFVDPATGKPTRLRRELSGERFVRIAQKSGKEV